MGEGEKAGRRFIVQRAVKPIIEQEPVPDAREVGFESVVTLMPVKDAARLTDDETVWEDFAEYEAPRGTQRKTVVTAVTRGIPDEELPQFFRALDDENEPPIPVRVDRPLAPPRRMVG